MNETTCSLGIERAGDAAGRKFRSWIRGNGLCRRADRGRRLWSGQCHVRPGAEGADPPALLVTFGAFLLIINALMLQFAAALLPGIEVRGFWPAFWAALLLAVL